jgi:hypothetical protein
MDLPVIRRHQQRCVLGERVAKGADEAVGRPKLGDVERVVQTVLVGDGVDTRVVPVDEAFPRTHEAPAVLDERRHRVPADEPGTAELRVREARMPELAARHNGNRPSEESRVALHLEGVGRAPGPRGLPAQDVEDGVAHTHSEPHEPVL